MAAFANKLTSAEFSAALRGIRFRNRDGLAGEYLFGGTMAASTKNRADPSKPLTVQGAPTINTDHAVIRSHDTTGFGFQTGIVPNDDCTLILVRKNAATATQPHIMGCGIAAGNCIGFRELAGVNYGSNGEGAINLGANRAQPGAAVIYMEMLVLSRRNPQLGTGGFGKLYYTNAGVLTEVVSANLNGWPRNELSGRQILIGTTGLTDTFNANSCAVYAAGIYQRALGLAELQDMRVDLITDFQRRLALTVV